MLEDITVRFGESHFRRLDRGHLAEAVAFFGRVRLVVGLPDIRGLFSSINFDELRELVCNEHLDFIFIPDTPVCVSYRNSSNAIESDFDFIRHKLEVGNLIITDPSEMLEYEMKNAFRHIKDFSAITRRIKILRFEDILHLEPVQFVEGLKERIVKTGYGPEVCRNLVEYFQPPSVPEGLFDYTFKRGEYGLVAESVVKGNVSVSVPRRLPGKPPFGFMPGSFLTAMLDSAFENEIIETFGSTMQQSETGVLCAKAYFNSAMASKDSDLTQLSLFNDIIFEGIPCVGDAVRQGRRNLIDLLPVVEKKRRFTDWSAKIASDRSLATAYIREISGGSWLDRLPVKGVRFSIFTGAGLALEPATTLVGLPGAATAAGVALGATDAFIVDKILKGWSPTMYVDELTSFSTQ